MMFLNLFLPGVGAEVQVEKGAGQGKGDGVQAGWVQDSISGDLTKILIKPRITWESAGGVWMPLQWRTTWTSSLWSHFYTSMENAMLEILFGKDYIYEYTSKIHDIEYLL